MPGTIHIPDDKRPNKFRAKRTTVDGITFHSKGEAARWGWLVLMERAGLIFDLKRQVEFVFTVNGVEIGKYTADFVYRARAYVPPKKGERMSGGTEQGLIVEDYKSAPTRKLADYQLRKKLLKALYGIDLLETGS